MHAIERFSARRSIPLVVTATFMLAGILALGGCASSAPPTATPTPAPSPTQVIENRLSAAERAEIFEAVLQTINDEYFDPTFGGQDWQAISDAYRQTLATVQDDRAFWVEVLNPMLFELGVSHVGALPPELSSQMDPMTFSAGTLGMDVRGNPGGVFPVRKAIASQLVGERTLFMRYQLRNEVEESYLDFVPDPYPGRVVILVDELSASSSEEFAGSLQSLGRATIVGSQTPGRCLVANLAPLPGGGVLSYPYGQSQTPDGRVLEGNGVVPDVEVALDRASLLRGIDTQLEAAIEYVNSATPADRPASAGNHTSTGVSVVDVEQETILADQTVVIEDGLIQAVSPRADLATPRGSHVIDGRGLYLMPGLVDAHVHFFDPPVFGRAMIANGVLLARDMGQPTEQVLKLRAALNGGELLGPEMVATGSMLDRYPPVIPAISLGLTTPEAGRNAVRQQAAAGVDQIKVYSRLNKDVFLAIVDEALQAGLKVVGHVPDAITIEDAAAAGLNSSEHPFGFEKVIVRLLGGSARTTYAGMGSEASILQRLDEVNPEELDDVYQQLRASGLTVCPTVVTFQVGTNYEAILAGDYPASEYISPGILDLWRSQWASQDDLPDFIWQNWVRIVSQLNQAGVPLMVGTDLVAPGIIPGYSVHQEMEIWQEAGISPADILRSATLVPARFMGLADRLGAVAEGKDASLVLVTANPLDDIRNAQLIDGVFLCGQYYSRADLDRLLAEARQLAAPQP